MVKSGSLDNVSRAGDHNVFHKVSLIPAYSDPGFPTVAMEVKKYFGSELPSGNHRKSRVWEKWNLIWMFEHQFLSSTPNVGPKYDLSRPGETCRCSNDCLRVFSVADFGTLKYSWEMRETPFWGHRFLGCGTMVGGASDPNCSA